MANARRCETYAEFWPFYLGKHRRSGTRALHLLGTGLGLVLLAAAIATRDWGLLMAAVIAGYGFAWLGHAVVERNRPATFQYPWWSFVSDFRMLGLWLSGRLASELSHHGIAAPEPNTR